MTTEEFFFFFKVFFFSKFFPSPDVTTENNGLRKFFQVPMSLRKTMVFEIFYKSRCHYGKQSPPKNFKSPDVTTENNRLRKFLQVPMSLRKTMFFEFFPSPDVTTENNHLRNVSQVPISLRKIIPLIGLFRPCSFPLYHWKRKINDFGVFFSV